jgi:phage terminase large subunit-like protein
MTCSDPEKRVSAAESYQIFRDIVDSWSEKQLSKRIWFKGITRWNRFLIYHFTKKNIAQVLPSYIDFESPNGFVGFL